MLRLPQPPKTLINHPIRCISCREQFTISEDWPDRGQERTQDWRQPNDQYPSTPLRYDPRHAQRHVIPELRAEPDIDETLFDSWQQAPRHNYLNCPRCGADNRNWLHIQQEANRQWLWQKFPLAAIGLCISATLFLIAAYAIWEELPGMPTQITQQVALLLFILLAGIVPTLVITGAWKSLRQHLATRSFARTRGLPPPLAKGLGIAVGLVVVAPIGLFVLLPFFGDQAAQLNKPAVPPGLQQRIDTILTSYDGLEDNGSGKQASPLQAANGALLAMLENRRIQCYEPAIEQILIDLQTLQQGVSPQEQLFFDNAIRSLRDFQAQASPYCHQNDYINHAINQLTQLELFLRARCQPGTVCGAPAEAAMPPCGPAAPTPQPAAQPVPPCQADLIAAMLNQLWDFRQGLRNEPPPTLPDTLIAVRTQLPAISDSADLQLVAAQVEAMEAFFEDRRLAGRADFLFFVNWFMYVGVSGGAAVLLAYLATERFGQRVNGQVPPAVGYSLANLTRVVVWEARRSLEVAPVIAFVQWTDAKRNDQGGMILEGVHREHPQFDQASSAYETWVRAQKYTISTNIWGRIEAVQVKDTRVKPSVSHTDHAWEAPERPLPEAPPLPLLDPGQTAVLVLHRHRKLLPVRR